MTFGLKNAGATYQRAMNYIFHSLIGRIVEIYIDDVVVKLEDCDKHLADLKETLECARKHGFFEIELCESLEEAIDLCYQNAQSGEAVLLSPACASWGMFKNYEERGDKFKELVNKMR